MKMSWDIYHVHTFDYVIEGIFKECERSLPNESAGYLVGRFCKWYERYYTLIRDYIPVKSIATPTYLAIIPQELGKVVDRLKKASPNDIIVGWYHSHPGHGLFLSELDLSTQRMVFRESYHVALVVDPIRGRYKFFKLTHDGNSYVEVSYAVWRATNHGQK